MFDVVTNTLFVHIPKTGGQSITSWFLDLRGLKWVDRGRLLIHQNFDPNNGPPQSAHLTVDEYATSGLLPITVIEDAVKFCVVRNPWARLWSEYNFNWSDHCSWNEFFAIFPNGIEDDHAIGFDAARHIKPQVEFINDTVNVLKFENLVDDFEEFRKLNRLPLGLLLKHVNGSISCNYDSVYDQKKIEIVERYYEKDIETFGYEF